MEKVSFQQTLAKNKNNYMANISHGRGIMMTLPEEWYVLPAFSTLTGKESETGGLITVRANVKQLISSYVQYRRVDRNDTVNRLPNLDYRKPSSLRIQNKLWKGLRNGLYVDDMDKVEQFIVTCKLHQ